MSLTFLQGHVLDKLATLPRGSVHCVVTSPPYWGLRDYKLPSVLWPTGWNGCHGLEPTMDLYIQHEVLIFREVRRVLRDDGTLWLNLGDSYSNDTKWGGKSGGKNYTSANGGYQGQRVRRGKDCDPKRGESAHGQPMQQFPTGLKPKDLCGIPWRVALALQQPFYTGKISKESDRIWLAAMIDAEGCMFIHKRKAGSSAYSSWIKKDGSESNYVRTSDTYGVGLEVTNTHESVVQRCLEIAKIGSVCTQGPTQNYRRKQVLYRWNARISECRSVIREVYPYLVAKKQQARILLGCPASGEEASKAHRALIDLHNGIPTDVDFPEPPSLYEPGWYLRMDNIWAKKNAMPESVTDRPTKAHEYVFLLTKQPRYFYDQQAVKEPIQSDRFRGPAEHPDKLSTNGNSGLGKWAARTKSGNNRKSFRGGGAYTNGNSFDNSAAKENQTHGNCENFSGTRNKRSVWTIASEPFKGAHFATFPKALVLPCILAGTSARGCCAKCGSPWERVLAVDRFGKKDYNGKYSHADENSAGRNILASVNAARQAGGEHDNPFPAKKTIGWQPTCKCECAEVVPCTVLDPFLGSGTTAQVALEHGRHAIGIELSTEYEKFIRDRTAITPGLPLA